MSYCRNSEETDDPTSLIGSETPPCWSDHGWTSDLVPVKSSVKHPLTIISPSIPHLQIWERSLPQRSSHTVTLWRELDSEFPSTVQLFRLIHGPKITSRSDSLPLEEKFSHTHADQLFQWHHFHLVIKKWSLTLGILRTLVSNLVQRSYMSIWKRSRKWYVQVPELSEVVLVTNLWSQSTLFSFDTSSSPCRSVLK